MAICGLDVDFQHPMNSCPMSGGYKQRSLNMSKIQPYSLSNGGIVDIEVEDTDTRRGAGPVGTGIGEKMKKSSETLREALATIPELADDIHAAIVEKQRSASEVQVEFGFKVGMDTGIIIAKSSAEANFKVSIKWEKDGK
jgi:hypothetical protein